MNYVKHFNLFGIEAKEIPCITDSGKPTSKTVGAVGCLYMNEDNGEIFKCIAEKNGEYTWVDMQTGGGSSTGLKREIVENLPDPSDAQSNVIYMVRNTEETGEDFYKEYLLVGDKKHKSYYYSEVKLISWTKNGVVQLSRSETVKDAMIINVTNSSGITELQLESPNGDVHLISSDDMYVSLLYRDFVYEGYDKGLVTIDFSCNIPSSGSNGTLSFVKYNTYPDYELIGTSKCDLTDYVTNEQMNERLREYAVIDGLHYYLLPHFKKKLDWWQPNISYSKGDIVAALVNYQGIVQFVLMYCLNIHLSEGTEAVEGGIIIPTEAELSQWYIVTLKVQYANEAACDVNGNLITDTYVTKEELGDIDAALDKIIEIQNRLLGGDGI